MHASYEGGKEQAMKARSALFAAAVASFSGPLAAQMCAGNMDVTGNECNSPIALEVTAAIPVDTASSRKDATATIEGAGSTAASGQARSSETPPQPVFADRAVVAGATPAVVGRDGATPSDPLRR
jgi:hypothetical protein